MRPTGHGGVGLDKMILVVFFNIHDSMILCTVIDNYPQEQRQFWNNCSKNHKLILPSLVPVVRGDNELALIFVVFFI